MVPRSVSHSFGSSTVYLVPVQTSNLIINLEHDDWILDDDSRTLADLSFGVFKYSKNQHLHHSHHGLENETEVSLFNRELYETFKANPTVLIPLFFLSRQQVTTVSF